MRISLDDARTKLLESLSRYTEGNDLISETTIYNSERFGNWFKIDVNIVLKNGILLELTFQVDSYYVNISIEPHTYVELNGESFWKMMFAELIKVI